MPPPREQSVDVHTLTLAAPPGTTATGRIATVDFTKGALVVCMVLYHSLNYFRYDKELLKYLHFLPGSFIFIAGWVIAYVYRPRSRRGEAHVYGRLAIRGIKLVAIFIGLNLAAHSFVGGTYNHRPMGIDFFLDHLDSIFLTGESRAAVFEVLLPIAYLLLLAGPVLYVDTKTRWVLPIFSVAIVGAGILANSRGLLFFNGDLLSLGVVGLLTGLVRLENIDALAREHTPLLLAFAMYAVAVTYIYPTYEMNLIGVPLTLLVLHSAALAAGAEGWLTRQFVLLGRYSLVTYIVQIAILQALFQLARRLGVVDVALAGAFAITLVLTVWSAHLLDARRRRSPIAAAVYGALFA